MTAPRSDIEAPRTSSKLTAQTVDNTHNENNIVAVEMEMSEQQQHQFSGSKQPMMKSGAIGASSDAVWQHDNLTRGERHHKIEFAMKHVIFPDNKWIKLWDVLIIILLVMLLFTLPFQLGVSSSVLLNFGTHNGWATFNVAMNACFCVDTFLYFYRAYLHPKTGRLVFRLDKIRNRYLRTYFIPNLISCFPTAIIVGISDQQSTRSLLLLLVFDLFKFARFGRFHMIVQSSDVVNDFQNRFSAANLRLVKVLLLMGVVAHWFACIWCFVAYMETGFDFTKEGMGAHPNWISHWYEDNNVPGSINPIGEENFMDRYVLALFWSIQTITSIGYGNISPLTRTEWWVGSLLMLFAGFAWAFLIGAIVNSVNALDEHHEVYRTRIDQAQQLIQQFEAGNSDIKKKCATPFAENKSKPELDSSSPDNQENEGGDSSQKENTKGKVFLSVTAAFFGAQKVNNDNDDEKHSSNMASVDSGDINRRILRYIHSQHRKGHAMTYSSTCAERYPVLTTLTPELYRTACYSLLNTVLENVPYLSSKYLTQTQQGQIAEQCQFLEYAAGETFHNTDTDGPGRGVYLLQSGCAFATLRIKGHRPRMRVMTSGMNVKIQDFVLIEDDAKLKKMGILHTPTIHFIFLSFSKVVFIPRKTILDVISHADHPAWKSCARWRYLSCWLQLRRTFPDHLVTESTRTTKNIG
jgi:hypothetical protein